MRAKNIAWVITAAAVLLSSIGAAVAQEQAPEKTIEVNSQREVNLTPAQMLETTKKYRPEMDRAAYQVRTQLTIARQQRDVVKSLCLNDKLNQIDLAIRTANDRVTSLTAAVKQNDPDKSKHEFTVIQVLRERVGTLVTEANQCIGEETGFVGDTQLTVNIDPSIPDTDPTEFPTDPVFTEPPILSSPQQ
jgi:hypothetical protein